MARKPNFVRKKKRKVHGAAFWDKEYTNPEHLKLSENVSEDLAKFTRWLNRNNESAHLLTSGNTVIDAGCGNGRNLIYLAREFGMTGLGIDISSAAIAQAKKLSDGLSIKYEVGSADTPLPTDDASQKLALDMMTSHFLDATGRKNLRDEFFRVLAPGGYLFMKTFLKDEDLHTARLLKDHPGAEVGTYIHPVMGVPEYVYSEEELVAFLSEKFIIRKIYRSHKHAFRGQARKRRTISIYAEKDYSSRSDLD
jgi:SAM-dependent methyltransferase